MLGNISRFITLTADDHTRAERKPSKVGGRRGWSCQKKKREPLSGGSSNKWYITNRAYSFQEGYDSDPVGQQDLLKYIHPRPASRLLRPYSMHVLGHKLER